MTDGRAGHAGNTTLLTIDLLEPDNGRRHQAWTDILSTYAGAPICYDEAYCGSHLVVAWAGEFSTAAARYAEVTGRPFRQIANLDDVPFAGVSSVFFVGEPFRFHEAALFELSGRARKPWGFLSARDRAGLSFALNKCIAAARAGWTDSLAAYCLDDVAVIDDVKTGSAAINKTALRADLLLRRHPWNAIIVHAHSEPGHTRCGEVVLCGVQADGERISGRSVMDGCREVHGKIDCKRGRVCGMDAVRYGDLRCRTLLLDTCCGISLGRELYPSDLSSVLSVGDGFPAYFISTISGVAEVSCATLVLIQRLARNLPPGPLTWLLNDIRERQMGMRPFVLFGDPAGDMAAVEKKLLVPNGTGQTPVVKRIASSANPVFGLAVAGEADSLVTGASMTACLVDVVTAAATPTWAIDRTTDVDAVAAFVDVVAGRLKQALTFERLAMCSGANAKNVALSEGLAKLRKLRLDLEDEIVDVHGMIAASRRNGVWLPNLQTYEQGVSRKLEVWTGTALQLFADFLWREDFWLLLTSTGKLVQSRWLAPPASCPQAADRHPVAERRFCHPLQDDSEILLKECAVCGVFSLTMNGMSELRIDGPESISPGSVAEFSIEQKWQDRCIAGRSAPGMAAVFMEKTTRRLLASQVMMPGRGVQRLAVKVPENILLDSHLLQVVWVSGGIWAYSARRIPALPAKSAAA